MQWFVYKSYCWYINDIYTHFVSLMKVWGWKTILLDRRTRWVGKKMIKIISKDQILLYENTLFCVFLKISNTGNFDWQIYPWKQHLQKKRSIPWQRQQKIQEICHLRFWIFKLLLQRFFNSKYAIFHNIEKSKKKQILTNLTSRMSHEGSIGKVKKMFSKGDFCC